MSAIGNCLDSQAVAQVKIDADVWFRKAMAVAQQRILKGEKSEAVLEELRKRFEERYGEDDRNAGLHASPNEGEA